jgi:hypothetical protein
VLPGFHSLQDAILLARRQTAETLQTLAQQLLARGRKAAELGIIVQGFLLLLGRKILVAAQPLSGVIALPGLPARPEVPLAANARRALMCSAGDLRLARRV